MLLLPRSFLILPRKKFSKTPEKFGKGHIAGVAGPESANNAASGGAMIPLLTLGIPGSGTTAILMGALIMYNIQPGPLLFDEHPEVAWGLIASMFIGNLMLLVLNMPLVRIFAKVIETPKKISFAYHYRYIFLRCLRSSIYNIRFIFITRLRSTWLSLC